MRVLVIGASGRTGKLVLEGSIIEVPGHHTTALARDPPALEGYKVNIVKAMDVNPIYL
ncbi:flavin reductase [Penicillium pulvis]|uniref:flavin reductase n=1 Tax=Penicillium pulvis TaxID=1562058 RepID=UPI0025486C2A|nr:flavin reductase [Penicillium pulvis]KAJ5805651.1 flavin reductase [Penicillium pulvis]